MDDLFKVEVLKYRKSVTYKTFQGFRLKSRHMAIFYFVNRRTTSIYFNAIKTKDCNDMTDFWMYTEICSTSLFQNEFDFSSAKIPIILPHYFCD